MSQDAFANWYDNQTVVHPVGLAVLVLLGIGTLIVPRRWAFIPIIALSCTIPPAQRVVVAELDFTFLRVLVLVGWVRLFARAEHRGIKLTPLDVTFVALIVVSSLAHIVRVSTVSALIFKLGVALEALGLFFLVRCLIRSWADLDRFVKVLAVISIPTAVTFLWEWNTGRNVFSIFGGVAEFTSVREGRLRCQGAYGNAILAGSFWASLVSLLVARRWQRGSSQLLVALSVVSALVIVISSASSTPVLGVVVAFLGALFFPIRFQLKWVRWGIAATLIALHMVMKAPVWHLVSRVDLVGGSTGYHRYNLIDQFLRNFGEWWLIGTNTTVHWGWGLHDVANYFVAYGVNGGLASLILFVAVICLAFRQIGRLLRDSAGNPGRTAYAWALGLALLAHTTMFFGVAYFGQILVVFYGTLAAVASLSSWVRWIPLEAHTNRSPSPPAPSLPGAPLHQAIRSSTPGRSSRVRR